MCLAVIITVLTEFWLFFIEWNEWLETGHLVA